MPSAARIFYLAVFALLGSTHADSHSEKPGHHTVNTCAVRDTRDTGNRLRLADNASLRKD